MYTSIGPMRRALLCSFLGPVRRAPILKENSLLRTGNDGFFNALDESDYTSKG
jgi:hypothetical protein